MFFVDILRVVWGLCFFIVVVGVTYKLVFIISFCCFLRIEFGVVEKKLVIFRCFFRWLEMVVMRGWGCSVF